MPMLLLSMDLAVNDYSKGEEVTQWVCSVPSAPSRHSAYASGRQSFQSLCGYFPMTAQLGSELFHLFVVNDPLDVFCIHSNFSTSSTSLTFACAITICAFLSAVTFTAFYWISCGIIVAVPIAPTTFFRSMTMVP